MRRTRRPSRTALYTRHRHGDEGQWHEEGGSGDFGFAEEERVAERPHRLTSRTSISRSTRFDDPVPPSHALEATLPTQAQHPYHQHQNHSRRHFSSRRRPAANNQPQVTPRRAPTSSRRVARSATPSRPVAPTRSAPRSTASSAARPAPSRVTRTPTPTSRRASPGTTRLS